MLQKNYHEAVPAFEKAVAANLNNEAALSHYTIALYTTEEKDKALELAKKHIANHPTELTTSRNAIKSRPNTFKNLCMMLLK